MGKMDAYFSNSVVLTIAVFLCYKAVSSQEEKNRAVMRTNPRYGGHMKFGKNLWALFLCTACAFWFFACQKDKSITADNAKPQMTAEELQADVPALHDLHTIIYPLWHEAYPEKDFALIKEMLPEADALTQHLDEAGLPGILRDKKPEWEKGKENLKKSLQDLHIAVEEDDQEAMLNQVEALHSAFEKLVRIIRPVVPELEDFHQEMYKVYHYYMPDHDWDSIRTAVVAMRDKIGPLKEVQLPKRLAEKQGTFDAAVKDLETTLDNLFEAVKSDDEEFIDDAVEKVHSAYQKVEALFD